MYETPYKNLSLNENKPGVQLLLLLRYLFPVALGLSLAILVHANEQLPFSWPGLTLFLMGIGAAYSLDRLWDHKGTLHSKWVDRTILSVFLLCTMIGLIAAIQIPRISLLAVAFFSVSSILYKWVKKYYLVKTLIVTAVWMWAMMVLPVRGGSVFTWHWWTSGFALPLSLEFAVAAILCDVKDIRTDREHDVQSLPVILGVKATTLIVGAVSLLAALIAWQEGYYAICIGGVGLAILSQFRPLLLRKDLGSLAVDATLALPGLLVVLNLVR